MSCYLTDRQVGHRYGVDRAAIWRWCKTENEFPQPIKLTPGTTRWRLCELKDWEAKRAEKSHVS
jgi:predicted DNA-binding transcriptional regulator AlpA